MKTIKAESFDLMQYFYGTVHDPLIHCFIRLSSRLDETLLKKAVKLSFDAIPQMSCCFDASGKRPRWVKRNFSGEDVVCIIQAEKDEEEQSKRLLASSIAIDREPQIKVFLIKGQKSDLLCVIVNHMVCDGAGLKEYLYLLGGIYAGLEKDFSLRPVLKSESRSAGILFKDLSLSERLGIFLSKYDLSPLKEQKPLCLEGDRTHPFFTTLLIPKNEFSLIREAARQENATANDMFLTSYVRVLSRRMETKKIVIPCPTDLRRYLPRNRKCGICNLTTNYVCDVTIEKDDTFRDTLTQVARRMKLQKDSRSCLKSVMLLELAFHTLPFGYLKKNFGKLFYIPMLSYTNLGLIDKQLLNFGSVSVAEAFLTGAVKNVPYFQVAVSGFDDSCTLSCNLHGTERDKTWIEGFLDEMAAELKLL